LSSPFRRRISITKRQRQTAAAVELIALCQTVTEDGSLTPEEIQSLKEWLVEHERIDLPASDYLRARVAKATADGKIAQDELRELYLVVEAVLPPDIRTLVRGRRRALEQKAREEARAARESERARSRLEQKAAPLAEWDFMVAGTRYEGRASVIAHYARRGDRVYLARDRANAYSRNAVEVRLANGMQIGYVPETLAQEMAPLLDNGCLQEAHIKKILTAGRGPIPVVVASVYAAESARDGLVREDEVPTKIARDRAEPRPGGTRRLHVSWVAAALIGAAASALAILW
jgi:hypothetical protein